MPIDSLLLIGAGGHARVVLDALRRSDASRIVQVTDDNPALSGKGFEDLLIQGSDWCERQPPGPFHVAIGDNATRCRRFERALAVRGTPETIRHPGATIAATATVELGCFVAAGAVVAPGASVGRGAIVNHGAVVDHDCTLGSFVHVAPRATLGGGVILGAGAFVGAGAIVLPGIVVGENAVVGAGAVVTRNLPAGVTVVGVPARPLPSHV